MAAKRKEFLGCSGWNYKHWKETFYPPKLPQRKWLEYYAQKFNTVEVNNTFYRLPKEHTLQNWYAQSPKDFIFTLKASRYITHQKKLNNVGDEVVRFYKLADILEEKLGTILWQLPPQLHRNDERLISFCKLLSASYTNVIEFRHGSWFNEEVYDIMRKHKVSYCILSAWGMPGDLITTTDTAYIRFHGESKGWYHHNYSTNELKDWRHKMNSLKVKKIYAYFNNDFQAHAPYNCLALKEM